MPHNSSPDPDPDDSDTEYFEVDPSRRSVVYHSFETKLLLNRYHFFLDQHSGDLDIEHLTHLKELKLLGIKLRLQFLLRNWKGNFFSSHNEKKQIKQTAREGSDGLLHILHPKLPSYGDSEQTTHVHNLQLQVQLIDPCLVDIGVNNRYSPRTLRFRPKCGVPTAELEERFFFDQCGSGFGFCSRTNQYKGLRFLSRSIGFGVPGLIKLEAEINTLGTNLWRRVGDAPHYLHWYSGGCFLNGSLHWIVHDTENCFESMCCFDFGKERFQPFPGPSQFRGLPGQLRVDMMKMGVLKDGLSVFHHPNCYMLDIWVMKDYAVRESWTKDFVIKIPWVATYYGHIYQPLMVLNNGVPAFL
ncbi:hypothetical protein RHGRI_009877 [Rhododendron griersonianum]|uniref:F-box associated beta-propeller type 1 domain-containing protein n=1 Tax=Rhododendron griersonianum TaxID=479676 RepID=A0AAV6KGG5_9ERIC|nr:hypothetical protein RHGRI_009877 [Rhododendron griersonianum]